MKKTLYFTFIRMVMTLHLSLSYTAPPLAVCVCVWDFKSSLIKWATGNPMCGTHNGRIKSKPERKLFHLCYPLASMKVINVLVFGTVTRHKCARPCTVNSLFPNTINLFSKSQQKVFFFTKFTKVSKWPYLLIGLFNMSLSYSSVIRAPNRNVVWLTRCTLNVFSPH